MTLLLGITRMAAASLDRLYPHECVDCNREGHFLCSTCVDSIPQLVATCYLICAQPIAHRDTCSRCLELPLAIDGIRSQFLMQGTIR